MTVVRHNPEGLFPPYPCYSHAAEIRGDSRLLVISGLNGYQADGKTMPDSFEEQRDIIWNHLRTILRSADMDFPDLVSLRTYLADPRYDEANVRLRVKYLGTHRPTSTVVCCRLLDSRWSSRWKPWRRNSDEPRALRTREPSRKEMAQHHHG